MTVSPVSQRRDSTQVTRRSVLSSLAALPALALPALALVPRKAQAAPRPKPQTATDYGREMRAYLGLTERHTPMQSAQALLREFGGEFRVEYKRGWRFTSVFGKTICICAELSSEKRAREIAWAVGTARLGRAEPTDGDYASWLFETSRRANEFADGFLAA